ncbi:MAG: AbiV family abortive infection protein [Fervidobacterium sp.]
MRHLDIEELAEGIKLCIENAESLLNDAELLFNNGKFPRAFSLAVLSVEEMGKIPMLVRAACFEKDEKSRWSEFWKGWRNHEFKFGRSLGPGVLGLTLTLNKKLSDLIKKCETLKLRGFYVDFNKEIGKFEPPHLLLLRIKRKKLSKVPRSIYVRSKVYTETWKKLSRC